MMHARLHVVICVMLLKRLFSRRKNGGDMCALLSSHESDSSRIAGSGIMVDVADARALTGT